MSSDISDIVYMTAVMCSRMIPYSTLGRWESKFMSGRIGGNGLAVKSRSGQRAAVKRLVDLSKRLSSVGRFFFFV